MTHWIYLSKNSVVYELMADGLFIVLTTLIIFRIWRQTQNKYQHKVQTLERYRKEYDHVIENSLDAILFIENGRIIQCNASTLRLFGCAREEIIGQHPYHFSPVNQPDENESYEMAGGRVDAALNGEPQFFSWRHLKLDGTPFDAEVSLSASSLMGKKVVQAIVRDVTEQSTVRAKLLETEIKYREV